MIRHNLQRIHFGNEVIFGIADLCLKEMVAMMVLGDDEDQSKPGDSSGHI